MSLLSLISILEDANVRIVLLGSILIAAAAAAVGCFAFLRKRALVGDAVAHSVLPGIYLAYMISGVKSPLWLMPGAVIAGWLSILSIDFITNHSKIKADTAIAIVLSAFFALGILILTGIQDSGKANQAGLEQFIFGKAAAMTSLDLKVFSYTAVFLLTIIILFFKGFRIVAFNPDYARSIGLPVRLLEFLLSMITVLAISVGIQAVGVVLMAALLIAPATAARLWTHRLSIMLILAVLFAILSGMGGTYISLIRSEMPTGPWMVMFLTFFVILSIFLAPRRGLLAKRILRRNNRQKILLENVMKLFYKIGEAEQEMEAGRSISTLTSHRQFAIQPLKSALRKLKHKGFLLEEGGQWRLTREGINEGKKIVRLHRLWELYLTQKLRFQADHVHNNAEAIEHLLTPEMEAILEKELSFPEKDPHQRKIPPK